MKLYVTCLSSNTTKSKLPSFQAHNELLFWLDSFELLVVRGGLFVVCCYCCELFLVGFVICCMLFIAKCLLCGCVDVCWCFRSCCCCCCCFSCPLVSSDLKNNC